MCLFLVKSRIKPCSTKLTVAESLVKCDRQTTMGESRPERMYA